MTTLQFDFIGSSIQTFTVPLGVTLISIEAHGARSGPISGGAGIRGNGAMASAQFTVIEGAVYDVYVGESPPGAYNGGWPNGGNAASSGSSGGGGGGRSEIRPTGTTITSALIVAGGGGGPGDGSVDLHGGDGGFNGSNGGGGFVPGFGATQTAGGPSSGGPVPSDIGGHPGGSDAKPTSSFTFAGGGGGDGYYGGSGAGGLTGFDGYCGGGGGGSSYVSPAGTNVVYLDGTNTGHGYIIFSWTDVGSASGWGMG